MKKLSLSTTLAALLLAAVSCSNDEPEIPIEEPKIGAPAEVTVDSKRAPARSPTRSPTQSRAHA